MYQFLLTLEGDKTVIINSFHPVNFSYCNMVVSEMGYSEKVKKVSFVGMVEGL